MSLVSGFGSIMSMLIAFQFLNGIAVAFVVLNPSIVGDMVITEERGSAMSILVFAPLLGPVLGSVAGGYLSQTIGWRWVLWLTALSEAVIEIAFTILFRETYLVQILRTEAHRLRKQTRNPLYPSWYDQEVVSSLGRPLRMMVSSPMIFLLSIYTSIFYAYTYVVLWVFDGPRKFSISRTRYALSHPILSVRSMSNGDLKLLGFSSGCSVAEQV